MGKGAESRNRSKAHPRGHASLTAAYRARYPAKASKAHRPYRQAVSGHLGSSLPRAELQQRSGALRGDTGASYDGGQDDLVKD